jgi:hypothetical protein
MRNRPVVVILVCVALLMAVALALRAHGGGRLARLLPSIHGH